MLKRWEEEARKVKKGRKNKNLYLIFISISKNLHENVVIAFLKLVILLNITNLVFSHLASLSPSLSRHILLIYNAGKCTHLFLLLFLRKKRRKLGLHTPDLDRFSSCSFVIHKF